MLGSYVAGFGETGGLDLQDRFRELGAATARVVSPDTAWCTSAFSTPDGTYCFRTWAGEPFQVRSIDPYVSSPAGTRGLIERALGGAGLDVPGVPYEIVVADGVECVSFHVWHIDEAVDSLTNRNLWGRSDSQWADGISCVVDGDTVALVDVLDPQYESAAFEAWDVTRIDGRPYLIAARLPHEWSYVELYRMSDAGLSLVTRLEPQDVDRIVDPPTD